MMKLHEKSFYAGVAVLAVFAGVLLLGIFWSLQQIFLLRNVFAGQNPVAVLGIFAIVVGGGVYLLKVGSQVMKEIFRE